jgi:DNA repair exonuclease SbcCD ATPase subunit
MGEIESIHSEKKRMYDNVANKLDQEKERMDSDIKSVYNEYRDNERRYHFNNIQTEIYEVYLKRINNEAKFLNQPEKRLTNEFKSYSEFFTAKLRQQETIIKDLKSHQKHIKDNSENYSEQMNLFKNLRAILEVKRRTLKQAGEQLAGYEDTNAQGFDRFVVRD